MHLLILLAFCVGMYMLFPKGFKYLVGTWVGLAFGVFAWACCALGAHGLFCWAAFAGFSVLGIFAGCVFAAKG